MNARIRKEINKKEACQILTILKDEGYWDPVVTAFMTETQCMNRLVKMLNDYFKTHDSIIYWNKNSYFDELIKNAEITPLMHHYEYNKYKESLEES